MRADAPGVGVVPGRAIGVALRLVRVLGVGLGLGLLPSPNGRRRAARIPGGQDTTFVDGPYVGTSAHGRSRRYRYYTCFSRSRYGPDHARTTCR